MVDGGRRRDVDSLGQQNVAIGQLIVAGEFVPLLQASAHYVILALVTLAVPINTEKLFSGGAAGLSEVLPGFLAARKPRERPLQSSEQLAWRMKPWPRRRRRLTLAATTGAPDAGPQACRTSAGSDPPMLASAPGSDRFGPGSAQARGSDLFARLPLGELAIRRWASAARRSRPVLLSGAHARVRARRAHEAGTADAASTAASAQGTS